MIRCFKLFRRTDDNTPKYFFPLDHDRPDNGDDGNDRCFTHEHCILGYFLEDRFPAIGLTLVG